MQIRTVKASIAVAWCLLLSPQLSAYDADGPSPASPSAALKRSEIDEASRVEALREAYEAAQRLLMRPSVNQPAKLPPTAREFQEKVWCAKAGSTLQQSLALWAETASWLLRWHSDYDYPILADICFTGTFEKAMEEMVDAYKEAEFPLYLDVYPQQQLTVITH